MGQLLTNTQNSCIAICGVEKILRIEPQFFAHDEHSEMIHEGLSYYRLKGRDRKISIFGFDARHDQYRLSLQHLFQTLCIGAVIFVIDATYRHEIEQQGKVMLELMSSQELDKAVLRVMAITDLRYCDIDPSKEQLTKLLTINEIDSRINRELHILTQGQAIESDQSFQLPQPEDNLTNSDLLKQLNETFMLILEEITVTMDQMAHEIV